MLETNAAAVFEVGFYEQYGKELFDIRRYDFDKSQRLDTLQ